MTKYTELINLLRTCSDSFVNDLRVVSPALRDSIPVLKGYGISFEDQAEGISIDLTVQPMKIFLSKASAVRYLKEKDFLSDIVVIEEDDDKAGCKEIIYLHDAEPRSSSCLFENLEYRFKFRTLFLEKGIASYFDEAFNRLIFLSSKQGKLHVTCDDVWFGEFYDSNNDIKNQYHRLEDGINLSIDYADFFRESFIEYAKSIPDENSRLLLSLKSIKHIVESASRNFDLYKHNFSFSDFKKELDEDKEKYLKDYQANLSDFLSKVASMPIQFGVYIYLIIRFSEDLLAITTTAIIIFFWSVFKVITVNRILENIEYFKSKFQRDFDLLVERSGIDESEVESDRLQIEKKFGKSLALIKSYRIFVAVFTLCSLIICMRFVMSILCS